MILPVDINRSDLFSLGLNPEQAEDVVDSVVKEITALVALQWEKEAKNGLKGTRERYIKNLHVVDEGRLKGAVILDYSKDVLIKMLEEGASAFDIKKGFERSAKRKEKKDGGWYLTIPMRQGTPGAIGESVQFANIMPSEIYDAVRDKPTSPLTDQSTGLSKKELSDLPEQYSIPKTRALIEDKITSKRFEAYVHKTSIYQGIVKIKDNTTGQNTYMSFRRVSDKSEENSWIHGGLEARNYAEKALEKVESNLPSELTEMIDNALAKLGFE